MEDRDTPRMRKYGESKTTRIMMSTVPHVTSGSGLIWRTRKLARWETYQRQLISGNEVMCGQHSQIFDRAKPQGVTRHIQSEQNLYFSSGMPIKKTHSSPQYMALQFTNYDTDVIKTQSCENPLRN